MMKRYLTSLLILCTAFAFAQVDDNRQSDLEKLLNCGGDLFSAPTHFDTQDWILLSSTLGLTAAATFIDDDIRSTTLRNQGTFGNSIFKIDDIYHVEFVVASIAGIYVFGLAAKDSKFQNLGLRLTEATVYAGSINLFTKFLFGRERPTNQDNPTNFKPFSTSWNFNSLPSGHTTLAFAYSTVMASIYDNFFWKTAWYSLAVLVGAARIYHNAHWFSDVFLGGAIGYFVGDFVNKHSSNEKVEDAANSSNSSQEFKISFGFVQSDCFSVSFRLAF
jgi:membrane-associated phospholipid phosphatase